jgi:hypothetical protein
MSAANADTKLADDLKLLGEDARMPLRPVLEQS